MPLTHYTDRHIVRLLATQSRRTDITPQELTRSHVALGRFLAGELVEHLALEPCVIQHPQGVRQGWQLAKESHIAVLCLMRAGLYVTEGVREVLTKAPVFHVDPKRGVGLTDKDLDSLPFVEDQTFVLVDSVINTGASMEPMFEQLRSRGAARIFVLTLVGPVPTAQRLEREHPDVHFLYARVSENQYVGKGKTDTGNRLFGTLPTTGA